jgi:hypothetical protein
MLTGSGMHACLQAPAADLTSLIAWFRDCSDADHSARLAFPASLSKAQRARIHTLVTSVGLGCLESVSEGVGEERFIFIVRSGAKPCQVAVRDSHERALRFLSNVSAPVDGRRCAPQDALSEAGENKAHWLYVWARRGGMSVSRDEIKEMLRSDRLSPELRSIWEAGAAQQKLVIRLCDAVCEGDTAALKACMHARLPQ